MSDEPNVKSWIPRSRKRVLMALAWMGVASIAWLSFALPNQTSENALLDGLRCTGLFAAPAIAVGTFFGGLRLQHEHRDQRPADPAPPRPFLRFVAHAVTLTDWRGGQRRGRRSRNQSVMLKTITPAGTLKITRNGSAHSRPRNIRPSASKGLMPSF
jgi:hypothetical protein